MKAEGAYMAEDLTHIQRHIDKLKIDAETDRRQAQNYRIRAESERNAGREAHYNDYTIQAERNDQSAEDKEKEASELESQKASQEAEVADLKRQLDDLKNDFNSRSKALEQEIKSKGGTSFSL
jgi:siderophore synthetase component